MEFGNFGSGLGPDLGSRTEEYYVVPVPTQIDPRGRPDQWAVTKGYNEQSANTVQTFSTKKSAESRGRELARNAGTGLTIFDAAKKRSNYVRYD